jgi:hypothetical protein
MEDLEVRWVTNLREDMKRFYLIIVLQRNLTPTPNFSPSSLGVCDNKYFSTSWKGEGNGFLTTEFKSLYSEIQDTQIEVLHQDV